MKSFTGLALAAATTFGLMTGAASAQEFLKYGEVEGWKVYVDNAKKSCLIESVDAAENVVQMGLTEDRGVGYVGVFTMADTGIDPGDKEAVVLLLGDNLYVGEATGMRGNITKGYSGGYILSDDPQFVTDIAQQYEMVVFPQETFAFKVDLTGTKKAIEMARECNAAQIGG
ncbi:MAG: hypothetical protein ACU0BB_01050 [Paracoccaceae bacterium]|jgi:hypothetical protein